MGQQASAEGASLLGRSGGMLPRKILKISLSENAFPGFQMPFKTKPKCLKVVKYFPFFSDLGQFSERDTFFHIDDIIVPFRTSYKV